MSARRWWPPALWACGVLIATWLPGAYLPRVHAPGLDKIVHFVFFAVLAWLTYAALPARAGLRAACMVLVAIAAFGAIDEFVQQYIPGRSMELLDWVGDVAGGATGLALALATRRRGAERA